MDAQLDGDAVEALKKLTKDQRVLAPRHIIQVPLADRCKLATHRETRELPIQMVALAKGGPKVQAAKADELYSSSFSGSGRVKSIVAQAASIARKVEWMRAEDGQSPGDPLGDVPSYIFPAKGLWR